MKVLLLLTTVLPFVCVASFGGPRPYSTTLEDPFVVFGVNEIKKYLTTNGDTRPRAAVRIISSSQQVVAGTLYKFELEISGGDTNEVCKVAVLSQPWLQENERVTIREQPSCVAVNARVERQAKRLVGGQRAANLSDPDVQQAFAFLEVQHNARSNSLYYHKVTGARQVTRQMVNGIIFRFTDVTYARSDCRKNHTNPDNTACPVSANAETVATCSSQVYQSFGDKPDYTLTREDC
jgi:hypothetical protein